MKRFSELNLQIADGKKVFDCKTISITDVLNIEIEVHDFVSEIKTQHGEGRMVIKVVVEGEEAKFFTACQQIINALMATCENDLPFKTTIKKVKAGSSTSFKFT